MAHLWQVVVLCLLSPVVRLSSVTPTMTESSVTNGTESFVKNVTGDEFENYEYDAEASFNTFNWPELLTALAVYGVTMVLGIVGNSLIIFTICRYRRMKSITNVFLASLASADLLLIIICIPVKANADALPGNGGLATAARWYTVGSAVACVWGLAQILLHFYIKVKICM